MSRWKTLEQRFWEKVDITPGCWFWTGGTNGKSGYGQISLNYKKLLVHRVAIFLRDGVMPPANLQVDHICHVKLCVNPDHLTHNDADRRAVA